MPTARKPKKPSKAKSAPAPVKGVVRAKPATAAAKAPRKAATAAAKAPRKAATAAAKAPRKAAAKAPRKAAAAAAKAPRKAATAAAKAPRKAAAKAPRKGKKQLAGKGLRPSDLLPPDDAGELDADGKRNFGLRGAAPWVARHAAKHAAELKARNAQPPPPGSARATLRTPPEAEEIKAKVAQLHQLASKIRGLRKRLEKSFYEIGELLVQVQREDLHVAKGYASFETFLDREVDLGRSLAMRLIRITQTFVRDAAYDFGLERLIAALAALDGEISPPPAPSQPSSRGFSSPALPMKPPIRFAE